MNTSDSALSRLYKTVVVGPSIYSRIFYFILGAPLSMGINLGIFFLVQNKLGYSKDVAYFVSLTTITVVFSLWNYFINFRSARNYAECLPRYIVALSCCYAINYMLAHTGFKKIAHDVKLLQVAVIVTSTFLVSGIKFLLYHFWVYPHTPEPKESVEAGQN